MARGKNRAGRLKGAGEEAGEQARAGGGSSKLWVAVRKVKASRDVLTRWRRLTALGRSGSGTLVACSGGADSLALLLVLSTVNREKTRIVAGHVQHDLRARAETDNERELVARVCARLGIEMISSELRVRGKRGNAEGNARVGRYAILAQMAKERGLGFVATGHHADDQLETMILAMMRGSGLRGLRGIAGRRRLSADVAVIRPMLGIRRTDCQEICKAAGIEWAIDSSNGDVSLRRNRIRRDVVPVLEELKRDVAIRASEGARVVAEAQQSVCKRAKRVLEKAEIEGEEIVFSRGTLRRIDQIVLTELLMMGVKRLGRFAVSQGENGTEGRQISGRSLRACAGFVRTKGTGRKVFVLGNGAAEVSSKEVRIRLNAAGRG